MFTSQTWQEIRIYAQRSHNIISLKYPLVFYFFWTFIKYRVYTNKSDDYDKYPLKNLMICNQTLAER